MRAALALALALAVVGACGKGDVSPAPGGSVELDLVVRDAEQSKDSHDTIEEFHLKGRSLHWGTRTTGYGEDRIAPATGDVILTDAELLQVIDLCRTGHLAEDATSKVGELGGPGNILTMKATVTLDGVAGTSLVEHSKSWNGPVVEPSPRHRALDVVREMLTGLRERGHP